jgi:sigma-B regulation protein RsbU (phosphoserine phosphatase)
MQSPPIPINEDQRIAELRRLEILYTEPEEMFDRVTAELARIFEVPLAEINFVDRDVQFTKSFAADASVPKEFTDNPLVPREISICAHVVGQNKPLNIQDLAIDPEFADSPISKLGVRFYSGTPLRSEGHAVGTLCLIDVKPRDISPREQQLLRMVADGVMSAVRLRSATKDLMQRTRAMADDLSHARNVQRFMLPPSEVEGAAYLFTNSYHPMDQIGGDFVDVKEWGDGSIGVLIADVSGHGASAALTSAMTKTSFVRCAHNRCDPSHLLTNLNHSLAPTTEPGRFMTALALVYDPVHRRATLASAGHPRPLLIRDGCATAIEVAAGIPLLIEEHWKYTEMTDLVLEPRDRLLMFTDGAVEARDPRGNILETTGLQGLVRQVSATRGPQFLAELFQRIDQFANENLSDDVAMACLEVR